MVYDIPNLKCNEKIKLEYNNKVYDSSKYIFMFSFITQLILNVGRFIGMKTLDDIEIGYLGILMMIPTVMTLVSGFIVQPEIVNLTKYYEHKKNKELHISIINLSKSLWKFSLLCILLAITFGPYVLNILYKLDFNNYRLTFVFLILAGTFNGLSSIYSNVITIIRKTKELFNSYIIVLVSSVILSYILSMYMNLNGVVIALMISMIIQYILFVLIMKRQNKTS
jgi:O-antigen/teichoic acid export membrane protein